MVQKRRKSQSKVKCPRSSRREEKLRILQRTISFGKNTTITYSLTTRFKTATSNSLLWRMHGNNKRNKRNKLNKRQRFLYLDRSRSSLFNIIYCIFNLLPNQFAGFGVSNEISTAVTSFRIHLKRNAWCAFSVTRSIILLQGKTRNILMYLG